MDLTRNKTMLEEGETSDNNLDPISDSQSPHSCACCNFRKLYPRLSHNKCSLHRDCTGIDKWEPYNCTSCKHELFLLTNKSSIDKRRSKLHFDRMLTETQLELNKFNKYWEFHKQARAFFTEFSPFPMWEQNTKREQLIMDIPLSQQSLSSQEDDLVSERSDKEIQSNSQSSDNSFDHRTKEQYNNYNCSRSQCSNTMASAQCNDPIHNDNLDFGDFLPRVTRKRNSLGIFTTQNLQEIDYTVHIEHTPITRYRPDPITGEPYFIFDSRIHLRVGETRINLVLPNISNNHLMIKSLDIKFTSDNATFLITELTGRKSHSRISEFWLKKLRSNPPINLG